jgi:nitroreductase
LDLLLDLETFVGLLLLHSMHQSWSYAWVSCPHHLLAVAASGLGCLVMGGIMIMSFGHSIL